MEKTFKSPPPPPLVAEEQLCNFCAQSTSARNSCRRLVTFQLVSLRFNFNFNKLTDTSFCSKSWFVCRFIRLRDEICGPTKPLIGSQIVLMSWRQPVRSSARRCLNEWMNICLCYCWLFLTNDLLFLKPAMPTNQTQDRSSWLEIARKRRQKWADKTTNDLELQCHYLHVLTFALVKLTLDSCKGGGGGGSLLIADLCEWKHDFCFHK